MRRRCVLEPVKCRYNPTSLRNPWRNLSDKIKSVVVRRWSPIEVVPNRWTAWRRLLGGGLENDETSEEGLVREFKEETGVKER